jgi:hypothetical protein
VDPALWMLRAIEKVQPSLPTPKHINECGMGNVPHVLVRSGLRGCVANSVGAIGASSGVWTVWCTCFEATQVALTGGRRMSHTAPCARAENHESTA